MARSKNIKLPQGEGSILYVEKSDHYRYRKMVNGKRVSTYGATPQEAMQKMRELESNATQFVAERIAKRDHSILRDDIMEYIVDHKKSTLKARSYDKVECIVRNQIMKYDLSNMQTYQIQPEDLSKHIRILIDAGLSFETVKKTYELLMQFFTLKYIRRPNDNPMLQVTKPRANAMNYQQKEISYFDDDEIRRFCEAALAKYPTGTPLVRLGDGLIMLLFTGLRASEALALQWQDVNFDERIIRIHSSVSQVRDRLDDYDINSMHRYVTKVTTPKTPSSIRDVYLNDQAYNALVRLRDITYDGPTSPVFATTTHKRVTLRNLEHMYKNTCKRANIVSEGGLHVLRHTFTSMMARYNSSVNFPVIAKQLGQSDTKMIERIYYHVSKEEVRKAVSELNVIQLNI